MRNGLKKLSLRLGTQGSSWANLWAANFALFVIDQGQQLRGGFLIALPGTSRIWSDIAHDGNNSILS